MASKCPQTFSILSWHSSSDTAGQVNWNQKDKPRCRFSLSLTKCRLSENIQRKSPRCLIKFWDLLDFSKKKLLDLVCMHPAMDLFFVFKSALLKHCTMRLSFSQIGNLRFSPQQPFSGCLIISDRNIWWLPAAQFHFWILFEYELNTFFCSSWIYKKSIAIQAVCRQDVNKIVGTSWTLASRQHQYFTRWKNYEKNVYFKLHFHN